MAAVMGAKMNQRTATRAQLILSVCALFSGAALISHIVLGVPLPLALAFLVCFVALISTFVWRRTPPARRSVLKTRVAIGARAGVVATLAYDGSKALFSRLDPSPYNPFETVRIFGELISGTTARAIAIPVGAAYHLLNGTAFGVAFAILLAGRGIMTGIAWGLGLEFFQLTLYPGWLGTNMYREFVQFSVLAHVVYGSTLAVICRRSLMRRRNPIQ